MQFINFMKKILGNDFRVICDVNHAFPMMNVIWALNNAQKPISISHKQKIIKKAVKHLDNVHVLPTLSYLVSKLTFPKYFLKEDQLISDEQTLVDAFV